MSSSSTTEKTLSTFYDARARPNPSQNLENVMQNLSVAEQTSLLCLLPYDICTMIYRLVLCSEEVLKIRPKVPTRSYPSQPDLFKLGAKGVSCGLLRTCRLFHHEATHLLYSKNTFYLDAFKLSPFLYGLLNTISQPNTAAIRTLSIYFIPQTLARLAQSIAADKNPLSEALRRLPGLQELILCRPSGDLHGDFQTVWRWVNGPDASYDSYYEYAQLWPKRVLTTALLDAIDGLPIEKIPSCRLFLELTIKHVRLVLNEKAPSIRMNVGTPGSHRERNQADWLYNI
ncbi:hypothetical protein MMC17_007228 [Xylographa soralifera]|nr:hypothetical protein [Xylographa soralifera]